MAHRAYWKGYIRLSLVSFQVRLYAAITSTEKISLHQYDKESGSRIRYQKVDESGEQVPEEDIVKGYEYEKGSYVPIENDDLNKLRLESKHTIELVQFTDINDVDPIYFEKSYYIVPDSEVAQEAFLTVRDALKKAKKAAIGQIVLRSKERIVAIRPCGAGLVMDTLRYAYEVREAATYFEDIPKKAKINKEQLELAGLLIDQKSRDFDPKAFKDHYQEGLMEIIKAKVKGKKVSTSGKKQTAENVVDIVEALKKSLKQDKQKTTKSRAPKSKAG